jgi:excisionase family DNA binding protein
VLDQATTVEMKHYTVRELADKLNVHYTTVMHLISRGKLQATRIGRLWRISEDQYQQYLKEQTVNA